MAFVDDILDALAPMLYAEDETGNALTTYLTGLSNPFELIEEWASDTDTKVGWALLLNVENCPDEALPWLAQFIGLQLQSGITADDQRQQIEDASNWKRGTPGAMRGAPAPYLTGSKTVIIRERYNVADPGPDYPGYLEVITYTDETPDSLAVAEALNRYKPAGIKMTYNVSTGQDFQSVKTNYATFQDVKNAYSSFSGLKLDEPGT